MSYAECQNEAVGADESVYNAINMVRNRVGLPNLDAGLDKGQMREKIRHERRVEFAYENQRYYDLRRWKTAIEVLDGKKFHGMKVTENEDGSLNYDPTYQVNVGGTQVFLEHHYLLPIPESELNKVPKLLQNPGY